VVKLNLPSPEPHKDSPAPYDELELSQEEVVGQVVASAGRSLVVLSGGSKIDDDHLLAQTKYIMEAGGTGVIYGRNVWQRSHEDAIEIIEQIKEIMLSAVRRIP
jgi:class I fructose-bisphosphate aldolase